MSVVQVFAHLLCRTEKAWLDAALLAMGYEFRVCSRYVGHVNLWESHN